HLPQRKTPGTEYFFCHLHSLPPQKSLSAPAMGRKGPRYHPIYPPKGESLCPVNAGIRRDSSPQSAAFRAPETGGSGLPLPCLAARTGRRLSVRWEKDIFSARSLYDGSYYKPPPALCQPPGGEENPPLP